MARYIDADKALEVWKEHDFIKLVGQERTAKTVLDALPSEDVAPVVHAHWNFHYYDSGYKASMACSACGGSMDSDAMDISHYVYCPCCGAKMDVEEDTQETHKD